MTRGLVLVTGASGAIGPAVLEALLSSGYAVRTLTRRRPELPPLQPVETHLGDITDPDALAPAMTGVTAVVHLAARLHFSGPPSRDIDAYRRVNVQGTANVVTAVTAASI